MSNSKENIRRSQQPQRNTSSRSGQPQKKNAAPGQRQRPSSSTSRSVTAKKPTQSGSRSSAPKRPSQSASKPRTSQAAPSKSSSTPKNTSKRQNKKTKFTPYSAVVAATGVLAISVACFSIFGEIHSPKEITTPPSSSVPADSQSSGSSKTEEKNDKNNSRNKDKDKDSSSSSSSSPEEVATLSNPRILTGKKLDEILKERTGISELENIMDLPVPMAKPDESGDDDSSASSKEEDSSSKDESEKDSSSSEVSPSDVSSSSDSSGLSIENTAKDGEKNESITDASLGMSGSGNIASWKAKNKDVIGWLRIPNTNIDYPVVVGPNNNYYSSLGYDKQYSKNGVIWADSYTKFGTSKEISKNTVLYGHNWTNYSANPQIGRPTDVMFAQLTSFHHLDFAKRTPYIHYSTEKEEMTWKVFAAFYTESSFNYLESDSTDAYMKNLISEAKKRSLHNYDVDVKSSDKILTLSTCTRAYGKTNQQRFVVMARLMRSGESVGSVTISANPNFKRPNIK